MTKPAPAHLSSPASQQHGAGAGAGASDASPRAVVVHVAPSHAFAASSAPASLHDAASSSSAATKQVASFAAMDDPPPAYEEYKSDLPVVERARSAEAAPAYSAPDPASPWAAAAALAAPAAPPDEPPMDLDALARSLNYPLLRPDEHGQLHLQSRPSGLMILFMMPLPSWFLGCCISRSNDLTFDDVTRTIRIVSWPGGCCCDCCKKERVLRYAEIVSVVALPHFMFIDDQPASVMHLQIAGGERVRISDPMAQPELERRAFALHRFLFGRANPRAYQQPAIADILLAEAV